MDGSAAPFARLISAAGLRALAWPRAYLMVRETVECARGAVDAGEARRAAHHLQHRLRPSPHPAAAVHRAAPAREFSERDRLARTSGFWGGGPRLPVPGSGPGRVPLNAVVLDDRQVLNPGGLRFPEECVRHKILDAVGDLALLGLPLLGHLEVGRGSHELHHSFMQLLMSRQADWRLWIPSGRSGKEKLLGSRRRCGKGPRLRRQLPVSSSQFPVGAGRGACLLFVVGRADPASPLLEGWRATDPSGWRAVVAFPPVPSQSPGLNTKRRLSDSASLRFKAQVELVLKPVATSGLGEEVGAQIPFAG